MNMCRGVAGKVASILKYKGFCMSYKVLALKWRPRSFDAVVGQQATLLALQHALDKNQLHHAYLFTGSRGVGKTTIARILAKSLNCSQGISSHPCGSCELCVSIDNGTCVDVIEIDAASRTKVEDTRELLDNVPYAPVQGRFKVYIIDEVHMLSNHSFNALLKTLEEPPEHVKFILATTDPQKLPITVLSRCLQFHLRNFNVEQIAQQLTNILTQENIAFEAEALTSIAQCANGSMRDALSLLEQVIAFGANNVTLQAAQQILGTAVAEQTLKLLEQIIASDARQAIMIVRDLAANNADFTQVLKLLQGLVYQLSLLQMVPNGLDNSGVDVARLQQLAAKVPAVDLQIYYQATLLAARDIPYAPDAVIGFEMLVLRMLAFQPAMASNMPLAVANTAPPNTPMSQAAPQVASQAMRAPITQTAPQVERAPAMTQAIPVNAPVQTAPVTVQTPPTQAMPINPAPTSVAQPTIVPTQSIAVTDASEWGHIISQLHLTGLSKIIAEHCILENLQPDSIQLTLNESQKPLLNAKHTERIQEALQKFYQRPLKLTINIGAVKTETPAAQGQRIQQAAHSAAEASIRADEHLQKFTETFAATITDIQIKSI